ncbi:MAG: hypothetical protein WCG95_05035 [bacterium]
MTFLSLSIEKESLTMEKSMLEYQEMVLSNHLNTVTGQLSDYLATQTNNENTGADCYAQSLQAQQQLYDSQKGSIESKLKAINAEIESYDKAITTNIKSECKLSLSV